MKHSDTPATNAQPNATPTNETRLSDAAQLSQQQLQQSRASDVRDFTQQLLSPAVALAPAPAPLTRCNVLGVNISAVNLDLATARIEAWINRRVDRNYVCITGVHGVIESQDNAQLKLIHNEAGMVTPDGMPMVWMNKLRGNSHVSRVYGPDLMLKVCREGVAKGWRHFFYGGADGVADLLKQKLTEKFPGMEVVGTFCPPFRKMTEEEDKALVDQINAAEPDIVWVGLSTPKQEFWMHGHLNKILAPVMIGVGAAFDFHAGLKKQAPGWMQKSGMEWFFRLCTEPKRLWKRYLKANPRFIWNIALQQLRLKSFDS